LAASVGAIEGAPSPTVRHGAVQGAAEPLPHAHAVPAGGGAPPAQKATSPPKLARTGYSGAQTVLV
jgi:hypothetical protein